MSTSPALHRTPLHALHLELGARMVPFAGYEMPVQYPSGLIAEHLHTRRAAGLFDVSHMGQLQLVGLDAAHAFETVMPVDVVDLPVGKQRYGLLLNDDGGILDDLMFVKRENDIFVVVNGACKNADLLYLQHRLGQRCEVIPLPEQALLALQGPLAVKALQRLCTGVAQLTFMSGAELRIADIPCFVTRSGYTGEDGFEISLPASRAEALARALLDQPEVKPIGLGARNSLRLEAGLCLYGQDIDAHTTPVEASLQWAISPVRRLGGARAGGFAGAHHVLTQLHDKTATRTRVGLRALERIPVREHTPLHDTDGGLIGQVTSGLISPILNQPIAMGYLPPAWAVPSLHLIAMVRGKPVPMEVFTPPFFPHRYVRKLSH